MKTIDGFTIYLPAFTILSTGADGGHQYIIGSINYEGQKKNVVVFFRSKTDEKKLNANNPIKIKGKLTDDGTSNSLILHTEEFSN